MPSARKYGRAHKAGQAMVETILVLFFLSIAFYTVFQFVDNLRARLLVDYAASRVARARTVGMNDFMLEKTANIATMAAAGECHTQTDTGARLSTRELINRSGDYLACEYLAQAQQVLDFELWRNGKTQAFCPLVGSKLTARVIQLRPQFFDLGSYLSGTPPVEKNDAPHARIAGEYSIEAHYPDWID
jgi:hypothetical protein